MEHEKSCGAVLFCTEDGERRFLLVDAHYFGLPKGHVEQGETEEQTAVREIKEETGIDAEIIKGFRESVNYKLPNGNSKEVVFFIAHYENQRYTVNHDELKNIVVAPYNKALRLLRYSDTKSVLRDAEDWLKKHFDPKRVM